jgi:catalase (peroxidase I)
MGNTVVLLLFSSNNDLRFGERIAQEVASREHHWQRKARLMEESKCPVTGKSGRPVAGGGTSVRDWWPNQLNLSILHQHSPLPNPMGEGLNYAEEFKTLGRACPIRS